MEGIGVATYDHRKLVERLTDAERYPEDPVSFREWIRTRVHLGLLEQNAGEDEIIVAALTRTSCVNSFVASADHPDLDGDVEVLRRWAPNPLRHNASSYVWVSKGAADEVRAEQRDGTWDLPPDVYPLVYGRSIEGVPDPTYYEIAQEYAHVANIHWRPERHAYSRIDHEGDWADVISVSTRDGNDMLDLLSFQRQSLELHLVAMNAVLVRTFDFTICRNTWPYRGDRTERMVRSGSGLYYREVFIGDDYGHFRGLQVVTPTLTSDEVNQLVTVGHIPDPAESRPVEFVVYDLRNDRVATVSTDCSTTTNYFAADQNTLPFDTSPASFRPEVLTKYKADTDKYTVQEGSISCRSGWILRSCWVNDAGQVCSYICDLRNLPHKEQLHWALHNEEPKTTKIPDLVLKTDFAGMWPNEDDLTPTSLLVLQLQRWAKHGVAWWKWAAEDSPAELTVPRTESRNEWLEACLALSNGVVEGFNLAVIRARLHEVGGEYKKTERSVLLLERLLLILGLIGNTERVTALWDINELRKVKVHAGRRGRQFADSALHQHGSYPAHFENLCTRLVAELKLIELAFDPLASDTPVTH